MSAPGSITALVETLVGVGATPEMILAAVRTAEDQKDAAIEQSREKARARVQKWRDKKAETSRNVTQRSVATTKRLTRGEDNLQDKVISGEEEKKVAAPSARPSRGSRIPDDFHPDIDAAVSEGVPRPEAERQARSFCDYWRSKPGSGGLKLDWPATWRVWYRRNIPVQPPPRSATAPPSGAEAHMGAVNSILDQIQGKTNAPQHGNQTIDGSYTRSDRSGAPNLVQFDAAAARYRS